MKKFSLFSALALSTILSTAQVQTPNAITYSSPIQIDSSDKFIIASLINKSNRLKYNFGQANRFIGNWTNVFIYNSTSGQSKKLFPSSPILILPIYNTTINPAYVAPQESRTSTFTKKYMIFLAKTDDYNHDGIIDEDDPVNLFISTKYGDNLTLVTPADMNVMSYILSTNQKTLLVRMQKDVNGDKKFTDEDEILYQVNMDEDLSKITMTPIKF